MPTSQFPVAGSQSPVDRAPTSWYCDCRSDPDFKRFLWYSNGSCNEFESEMLLARDLSFLPTNIHEGFDERLSEVRRMLTAFIQKL